MIQDVFESSRYWRATAEEHTSRGSRIMFLMDDGLIGGACYWLIADEREPRPVMVSDYDPTATARMIEIGKLRLVKGRLPDYVRTSALTSLATQEPAVGSAT
jgi:hypothetical protein